MGRDNVRNKDFPGVEREKKLAFKFILRHFARSRSAEGFSVEIMVSGPSPRSICSIRAMVQSALRVEEFEQFAELETLSVRPGQYETSSPRSGVDAGEIEKL